VSGNHSECAKLTSFTAKFGRGATLSAPKILKNKEF